MTPIYLLLEERSCLSVSTSDDNLGVIFPLGTFRRGHTGARFAPGQRDGCETDLTHNGRPAVWAGLSVTGHSVLSKDKGTEPREVRDLPKVTTRRRPSRTRSARHRGVIIKRTSTPSLFRAPYVFDVHSGGAEVRGHENDLPLGDTDLTVTLAAGLRLPSFPPFLARVRQRRKGWSTTPPPMPTALALVLCPRAEDCQSWGTAVGTPVNPPETRQP